MISPAICCKLALRSEGRRPDLFAPDPNASFDPTSASKRESSWSVKMTCSFGDGSLVEFDENIDDLQEKEGYYPLSIKNAIDRLLDLLFKRS